MSEPRDLVVIGSGPGGYVAAIRAAQLGMKVTVVEKDDRFGGTCLLRGCMPTKALLHSADLYEQVKAAEAFGVRPGEVSLDVARVHEYKRGVIDKNAKGVAYLFKKNGIETVQGFGRVTGPNRVQVGDGDGAQTIEAKHVLIATGSAPRDLPFAPANGDTILNSDHLLDHEAVPKSLVVLGAGAVGVEFASVFNAFGSEVTLVEVLPRILPIEDEEVSKEVTRAFRKRKIRSLTSTKLASAEAIDGGLRLTLEREGKEPETLETELLLVAVGRAPVTAELGLEALGVELDRGYVRVNETMRTAVPSIYAIGDVVDTPWLAHVAMQEGILAVEHMAGEEVRPLNYDHVPSCTYCDPEVGSVGLSEAEARDRGFEVATGKFPFTALGKAAILGKTAGFVKVVRDTKYDELLGVHIVGAHATDLIAEACVALKIESTTEELMRTMHAHPTLSEAVGEAAHAALGHAIHI
jgi:dihydrolipoamide dehydrogenase